MTPKPITLWTEMVAEDWRLELIYLALPNIEMSRRRVAERVSHGGHDIPDKDLTRRFPRSLANLQQFYGPLAHRARCYMNDSDQPILVFEESGGHRKILQPELFDRLWKNSLK